MLTSTRLRILLLSVVIGQHFKPYFGSTRISLDFLHTNKVPFCILIWISCILIRYRFTNKSRSSTIKTISLPNLAR